MPVVGESDEKSPIFAIPVCGAPLGKWVMWGPCGAPVGLLKTLKTTLTAWRPRLSLRLERLESSMEDRLRALEELDSQCGDPGKGDNPTHDQHMT